MKLGTSSYFERISLVDVRGDVVIFPDSKYKSETSILNFLKFALEFQSNILSDSVTIYELRENKSFN